LAPSRFGYGLTGRVSVPLRRPPLGRGSRRSFRKDNESDLSVALCSNVMPGYVSSPSHSERGVPEASGSSSLRSSSSSVSFPRLGLNADNTCPIRLVQVISSRIFPRRISRHSSGSSASPTRSEEHTSELQSRFDLVCRLLLEKKKLQHNSAPSSGSAVRCGEHASGLFLSDA